MSADVVDPHADTSEAERRAAERDRETLELCRSRAAIERQSPRRELTVDELVQLLRRTNPDRRPDGSAAT